MIRAAILAALLSACTTPSQWCIGACTQTNPAKLTQNYGDTIPPVKKEE